MHGLVGGRYPKCTTVATVKTGALDSPSWPCWFGPGALGWEQWQQQVLLFLEPSMTCSRRQADAGNVDKSGLVEGQGETRPGAGGHGRHAVHVECTYCRCRTLYNCRLELIMRLVFGAWHCFCASHLGVLGQLSASTPSTHLFSLSTIRIRAAQSSMSQMRTDAQEMRCMCPAHPILSAASSPPLLIRRGIAALASSSGSSRACNAHTYCTCNVGR